MRKLSLTLSRAAAAQILALALTACQGANRPAYTYSDLVERLTGLELLAILPPPGERTALASSFDRLSRYDPAQDRYLDWGANNDCCGVVGVNGWEQILADIRGAGVIWRMWAAQPAAGHIRIYLDGSAKPVTDLPFSDYFGGGHTPFQPSALVYRSAGGYNNYTPIPFASSCRIVADAGWGKYYQFTYSIFPPGTAVRPFRLPIPKADAAALTHAASLLGQAGSDPAGSRPLERTEAVEASLSPGQTREVIRLDGPQAITALKVRLDLPAGAGAQRKLLRSLVLKLTWDDDATPAVWSPLGDFFGVVGGASPYRSLPLGLLPDGTFYSYWYMPFRRARVEVANDGPFAVATSWRITHAPLSRPAEAFGRFHAKWHRDAFLPARADRAPDWTILTTRGRGRFVGTHLHVWNPRGGWWGEGDEKFFVDGERFPSIFGTGSEDYFGYAWSSDARFSRPYHGQLLNEKNRGNIDDNRWHIPDSVPFQTGFDGYIEKYFPNTRPTLYAGVAYWYLGPGAIDPYGPVPMSGRVGYDGTRGAAPRLRRMIAKAPQP